MIVVSWSISKAASSCPFGNTTVFALREHRAKAGASHLVVGNSKYEAFDMLADPKRDASVIAEALGKSGFQNVKVLVDVSPW